MDPHGDVIKANESGGGSAAQGQRGRPGLPKPWKSTENHGKSTSNCTTCTHMGPNHLKTMFCTSMHYFQVVLCTLLVPSKISRGIFIEFSWKSIGSNLSGPLAGPWKTSQIQKKTKKSKENQWSPGWLASPKPLRPLEILEKINKSY